MTVGVEGARIKDAASLGSALVAAGAPSAAVSTPRSPPPRPTPTYFEPVFASAALVVNSAGDGRPTCGPIVARFLNGL